MIKGVQGCLAPALVSLVLLTVVLVACSSTSQPTTAPAAPPAAAPPPDAAPSSAAAPASEALRVAFASTDLAVGPNRIAFGILDGNSNPVRLPEARATFVYLDSQPITPRARATAVFRQWPAGAAGVYVANVEFDRAGQWGIIAEVTGEDGTTRTGDAGFLVNEQSLAPAIGATVPASRHKTARDVADLREITTSPFPDPDLYQLTIAEALDTGRPTVVTFATPAFCQTATCGPQVAVVTSVKERHKGRADFIHVEAFDLVLEDGGAGRGPLSHVLVEWGLPSEPFTFILDADGLVASKFQGFVNEDELESALASVLGP